MDSDALKGIIELQKFPQDSGSSPEDKELSAKLENRTKAYLLKLMDYPHPCDVYHAGWFTEEGAGHGENPLTAFHCDDSWLEEPIKKKDEEDEQ